MYWSIIEQHSRVLKGLSFDFYWASHQLLQPARLGAQIGQELVGSWPKSFGDPRCRHFFLGILWQGTFDLPSLQLPDVCGPAAKVQELTVIWSKLSSRWSTLRFLLVQIWCSLRFLNLFDGFWFWIFFPQGPQSWEIDGFHKFHRYFSGVTTGPSWTHASHFCSPNGCPSSLGAAHRVEIDLHGSVVITARGAGRSTRAISVPWNILKSEALQLHCKMTWHL